MIILDRLFSSPGETIGFANNYYNIIPSIIAFIVVRLFGQSVIVSLVVSAVVFWYVNKEETEQFTSKMGFFNSLMYNGESEPYNIKNFLSMDRNIVNFFYKNADYIDYNLSAYRQSIESVNNLLQLEHQMAQYVRTPEQLFENAMIQYREALNSFHSIIYKLPTDKISNYRFDDNLVELRKLLLIHVNRMLRRLKKLNGIDISVFSTPTPLKLISDLSDKYYSPHYSFF